MKRSKFTRSSKRAKRGKIAVICRALVITGSDVNEWKAKCRGMELSARQPLKQGRRRASAAQTRRGRADARQPDAQDGGRKTVGHIARLGARRWGAIRRAARVCDARVA